MSFFMDPLKFLRSADFPIPVLSVVIALLMLGLQVPLRAQTTAPAELSPAIEKALADATTNRVQIATALQQVPADERDGMIFIITNMPPSDLQTLTAPFLLENSRLAYETRKSTPWGPDVPEAEFLNYVLPYANIDETRERWRPDLRALSLPLVADCKTASEAAQRLNERLFPKVNVKYSTQRRRANQAPLETMESGLASCTGLSILLVDACRSVGVPARLVGIPSWVDKRGNHTWIEIWDNGWHFLGAAEPDPAGLNRGWFVRDASMAIKDSREHAIYAVSFQKTSTPFPMVWSRNRDEVSAVNVTDSYTRFAAPVPDDESRLLVGVVERRGGIRLAIEVKVLSADGTTIAEGFSKDESADTNDILEIPLKRNESYVLEIRHQGRLIRQQVGPLTQPRERVTLHAGEVQLAGLLPPICYVPPRVTETLSDEISAKLKQSLTEYFKASSEAQATWKFSRELDEALEENEAAVRQIAWQTWKEATDHSAMEADHKEFRVRFNEHVSPFTLKTVGERPTDGWPLFIAMHGGGNGPQEMNDRQWRIMQEYYRDHPELGGYKYLALRAPNNTWNGFYDDYVYPLIAQLIRQNLLFEEVNANKVFLMGYSHGGYGAFAIGPKIPDRFAAIHASAAAPTDGETSAKTLRNTIFTFMIGEKDTAYGRMDRCRAFDESLKALRGSRVDIYPVMMEFKADAGHRGLPDKDKISDMYPAVRNPVPRELTWEMTDGVVKDFFWLHVPNPAKGREVEAACRNNRIEVRTRNVESASILLDSRLINLNRPVTAIVNGVEHEVDVQPQLSVLARTLVERGDIELAFVAEWPLPATK